jgi:PAS domain S-box-containing protein
MPEAPLSPEEPLRLAALRQLNLLDTPQEERFDRITRTAIRLFAVPIALVSLVDVNRQWFKSCIGLPLHETPRSMSFCAYAVLGDEPLVIPDAQADARFVDNPLVTHPPFIRFYAGHPLRGPDGYTIGTLCVLDLCPRTMNDADRVALRDLALWAEVEINTVEMSQALVIERESAQRVRAVMETVPDAIATGDRTGRIQSVNLAAEHMFGWPHGQILDQRLDVLLAPEDREWLRKSIERMAVNGSERGLCRDTEGQRRDGSRLPVAVTLAPFQIGGERHVLLRARDITEQKEAAAASQAAKEAAEEASRLKSEFLANISHELRTPLNAIIGFSEVLQDQTFGALNERQQRYVNNVLDSGRHLLALVNDILDLAKVEAGRMELRREELDLNTILATTVEQIRPVARRKNVFLHLERHPTPVRLHADRSRLVQVAYNLLSNAIKFTPAGGSVWARCRTEQESGLLIVEDTGIGIAQEDHARIFDEFVQVDSSVGRTQQGTGLGLALSRQLVELHDGWMTVESEPGRGSTFTAHLPRLPAML